MSRSHKELGELSSRNIFTTGIYHGSEESDYRRSLNLVSLDELIKLVQARAEKDGQWCIDNDLVGDNEDKMRKMMANVSSPKRIKECFEWIQTHEKGRTVDFICRDLANASRR